MNNRQIKLDTLDFKILFLLDRAARKPISELARALKQGRDTIEYRVRRLEEQGAIVGYRAYIVPAKLGLSVFKVSLRLERNAEAKAKLLVTLNKNPSVFWHAECVGRWDFTYSICARSSREFLNQQMQIASFHADVILEAEVSSLIDTWYAPRSYLVGKDADIEFEIPGDSERIKLDVIDLRVLSIVVKRGREAIAEIAKEIESTATVVTYRLEQLEKKGVIVAYRADIRLDSIGRMLFKAQLFPRKFNSDLEPMFRSLCLQHPDITKYSRQIGSSPIEIEVESLSYEDCNSSIDKVLAKCPGFIRHVELSLMRQKSVDWRPSEVVRL